MSYSITIAEVVNGLSVTNTANPYTVEIQEVVNNIEITPPASNTIAITNTTYPVTVNYNATVFAGSGSGLNNIVEDASPQLGGNLDVNGFVITSVSNSNITLSPNGTGGVRIVSPSQSNGGYGPAALLITDNDGTPNNIEFSASDQTQIFTGDGYISANNLTLASSGYVRFTSANNRVQIGDGSTLGTLTTGGAGNLRINTNSGTNSGEILLANGVGGDIQISPNSSGRVLLNSDVVRVGDSNVAATITTNGTGNLLLNTNSGTSSGSITIAQGANANITIEPNGTGDVLLNADTVRLGDAGGIATITTNGGAGLAIQPGGSGSGAFLSVGAGANAGVNFYSIGTGQVDFQTNNGLGAGFSATPTGLSFTAPNSISFISVANNLTFQSTITRVGKTDQNSTITSAGTGNLTINTNAGTNAGSIVLNQGTNANIAITPNGTGKIVLDGQAWPKNSATAGSVLSYGAGGVLIWSNPNSLEFSSGLTQFQDDTTPTLGGNLNVNNYPIVNNQTNGDIKLNPNGTGKVKLSNIAYPNTNGSQGQVLGTDGAGVASWVSKQDPTVVDNNQPEVQSTGQHWYRPVTGAMYTARNNGWEPINDDGFF
jgi:hypothetical protein